MDTNRMKQAAEWFYGTIFRDEPIAPKKQPSAESVPKLLRAARSLEGGPGSSWQSRQSVFLKQAKLLADYEDDYPFSEQVVRYSPTYASLTDQQLRGYFTWRTRLRRGELQKTCLTFAFLYIYELLNQVGAENPLEGYRKLTAFRDDYGALDDGILSYLKRWLADYVVYYQLDQSLLADSPQAEFDRSLAVLDNLREQSTAAVMEALGRLPLKWLSRSKFYRLYPQQMDTVIVRVLRRVAEHCDTRCKKGFIQQYLGDSQLDFAWLFESAVFCDPLKRRNYQYAASPRCVYRCQNGRWTVERFCLLPQRCARLDALLKAIDCVMREQWGYKHPIQSQVDTKWLLKIIREEAQALWEEQKAAQAKKLTFDRSQLERIRREAAITQEKLAVEEELEEPEPEAPAPQEDGASDTPLSPDEYRLLQCILYGRDRSWVRAQGLMLSVLLDSINEKLYDDFQDSVLDDQARPAPDYIDDLKERIQP